MMLGLCMFGCESGGGGSVADLAGIRRLQATDIAASKALDAETLISLWTDDIVALAPGQEPSIGKAAGAPRMRESLKQQREAGMRILEYEQDWRETVVTGEYAFQWGFITGAAQSGDADPVHYRFKAIRILRRDPDGEWRVHRTIWNEAPLEAEPTG